MAALKDTPLSTAWPGPTGGTLGSTPLSTPYGDSGYTLATAPEAIAWPPTFGGVPSAVKYQNIAVRYGGSTGSLDGETHLDSLDFLDISPFKFEDGGAMVAAIRAANPNCKILAYKAMSDLAGGANTVAGIRAGEGGISYAQAQAHDAGSAANDKWILKDGSGNPIGGVGGYPNNFWGDVGLASFQAQWLANARAALAYWGLTAGKDGLFIDNLIGFRFAGTPTAYATDAAWRAAVLNFCQNVFGALKADGWYILGNALDFNTDDQLTTTKAWWIALAPYISGAIQEGWMSTGADRTRLRRDTAGWQDYYRQITAIVDSAQSVGLDAHVLQISDATTGHEAEIVYGKVAWMLKWNGTSKGSVGWFVNGVDQYSPRWRFDIGQPLAPQNEIVPGVFVRRYAKCYVVLNANVTGSYTIPASPDGRAFTTYDGSTPIAYPMTVAAGSALIMRTTTSGGGVPTYEKVGTYSDNFDDGTVAQQWTAFTQVGATVVESGGGLNIAVPVNKGAYGGLKMLLSDLTASAASCSLAINTAFTNGNQEADFSLSFDASNFISWNVIWNGSAMVLRALKRVGGTQTVVGTINPYLPGSTHKFLRLREAGGTIFYDTSVDGITWTNRFSTTVSFAITALQLSLDAGQDSTTCPLIDVTFDNFNTTPAASYSAEILAEAALVAYWRLGEAAGSGTVADSKGTNTGTVAAGVTLGASALIAADPDKAASFGGTATGYISAASPALSGSWAVEMWANQTGPGSVGATDYGALFGADSSAARLLWHNVAGTDTRILAQFGGISLFSAPTNTPSPSLGARHHIVIEYKAADTSLHLYVDGTEVAFATVSSAPTLTAALFFGSYDHFHDNYMFNGVIDEIAIYNAVLGATKVASHYANGSA